MRDIEYVENDKEYGWNEIEHYDDEKYSDIYPDMEWWFEYQMQEWDDGEDYHYWGEDE